MLYKKKEKYLHYFDKYLLCYTFNGVTKMSLVLNSLLVYLSYVPRKVSKLLLPKLTKRDPLFSSTGCWVKTKMRAWVVECGEGRTQKTTDSIGSEGAIETVVLWNKRFKENCL